MDINVLKTIEIPAITVICYGIAFAIKKMNILSTNFLPLICAVLGCGLGIVGYFVVPEFPATDILTSIALGVVSGLAATGSDQVGKQLKEKFENKECSDDGEF